MGRETVISAKSRGEKTGKSVAEPIYFPSLREDVAREGSRKRRYGSIFLWF